MANAITTELPLASEAFTVQIRNDGIVVIGPWMSRCMRCWVFELDYHAEWIVEHCLPAMVNETVYIIRVTIVKIIPMKVRRTLAMLMIGFLVGLCAGGCATNYAVTGEDGASYGNDGTRYEGWRYGGWRYGGWNH